MSNDLDRYLTPTGRRHMAEFDRREAVRRTRIEAAPDTETMLALMIQHSEEDLAELASPEYAAMMQRIEGEHEERDRQARRRQFNTYALGVLWITLVAGLILLASH